MAFGIPGITAPAQPVPVNPIDALNPKSPAGPGPAGNASSIAPPDRMQRSLDAASNPNAYHDAILRAHGADAAATISASTLSDLKSQANPKIGSAVVALPAISASALAGTGASIGGAAMAAAPSVAATVGFPAAAGMMGADLVHTMSQQQYANAATATPPESWTARGFSQGQWQQHVQSAAQDGTNPYDLRTFPRRQATGYILR